MSATGNREAARMMRRAGPEDEEALRDLYRKAVAVAPWLPPDARAGRDLRAESKSETLFVCCEAEGAILGFVSVYAADAFVHHLYVSPHHQRQGVGTALLDSLDSWLPLPWRLKCVTANVDAMRFYAARGWTVESRGSGSDGPYALLRKDAA